jgi:hypothetical protein
MTVTLILAAAALLVAFFLLRAARGHAEIIRDLQDLEGRTQPVDLAAFRNLVDPAEEEYLRAHLRGSQFRTIQRQRLRAALEYIDRMKRNAAILLRLGESVRCDGNPEAATAARELVNSALRLRMNALLSTAVLYVRIATPEAHVSVGRVIDMYKSLTEGVVHLTRLQNPAYAARIAAII